MAHFQDYRDFRFWSRDHGRGRMTSLFNFDIDNKGCVIKWPMCSKKFPSYTTNIFLSNAPQKIRQCALKGRASFGCLPSKHSYKSFACQLFSDLTQLEKAYHAANTCNEHALTSELSPRSEIITVHHKNTKHTQFNCSTQLSNRHQSWM